MKNLSNIKSTLAVSMLLSASLFSMNANCGCPSKLAEEMLSEKVSASAYHTGGTESGAVYHGVRKMYDGRELGKVSLGGHSLITETREDKIVVQGGSEERLLEEVFANENTARMWATIQAREDAFNVSTAQYDIVRQRENFSSKQCLNAVVEAHIRGSVLVSNDVAVREALAKNDESNLAHFIGVRYVEGQNYLFEAQKTKAKSLKKQIEAQKKSLVALVAKTSENEEFNRLAGVSYTERSRKSTECGGLKVEYLRHGPCYPQYKELFASIKASKDLNAVAYLDHVMAIEDLDTQRDALGDRITKTKHRICVATEKNATLEVRAQETKNIFVQSLRNTTDERLYAQYGAMTNVKRINDDGKKLHQLCPEELAQRKNAATAEIQFQIRDLNHLGVQSTIDTRFARANYEFRAETFSQNDDLTSMMSRSEGSLHQAYLANDLVRLKAQGPKSLKAIEYRIDALQHELMNHVKDGSVHTWGRTIAVPAAAAKSLFNYLYSK